MRITVDVRRAYLYAPASRDVYVELPAEEAAQYGGRVCGRLRISFDGTRDAAANWEAELRSTMKAAEFTSGKASAVQ